MQSLAKRLTKAALILVISAGPALAQKKTVIPFDFGDPIKPKEPRQSVQLVKFAAVAEIMEKKGYHRLPGERLRNANDPPLTFNAPSGQHAEVAVPGPGCAGVWFEITDPASRKLYKGQPVGPGQAIFLNFRQDTDVQISLRADSPLCTIYLLGYQR